MPAPHGRGVHARRILHQQIAVPAQRVPDRTLSATLGENRLRHLFAQKRLFAMKHPLPIHRMLCDQAGTLAELTV